MKARVKATGAVVDVELRHFSGFSAYVDRMGVMYKGLYDLDFDLEGNHKGGQIITLPKDEPDYWTKLHHQAAITAMQGMLSNSSITEQKLTTRKGIIEDAERLATTLVEKLKSEKL